MLLSRRSCLALLSALVATNLAACGDGPLTLETPAPYPLPKPSEPPPKPPAETGPLLSDEPLWIVEGDPALKEACFGTSVAIGDVNGDKLPDLVVAIPQCTWLTSGAGRVAVYAGTGSFFSKEPVIVDLDWQNPKPPSLNYGLAVHTGDVNGDAFADILVRSRSGVLVVAGGADLAKSLSEPLFRVPGEKSFGAAELLDANGDGLHDLASLKQGVLSLYLATSGGAEPFTVSRTIEAYGITKMGDTNGDGADDLAVLGATGTEVYLGCGATSTLPCEGGLTSQVAWTVERTVLGALRDQNGDGFAETLLGDALPNIGLLGRVSLHLSDAQTGAPSLTPAWSALGDPLFSNFGHTVLQPGDIDNNPDSADLIVGAAGRVYAFLPGKEGVQDMRPAWAWPRSDAHAGRFSQTGTPVIAAGDLNGDGFDDIVIGSPPEVYSSELGKVMVFGGGKLPQPAPAEAEPYLPEKTPCGLGSGGLPDMTVDGDVIARSLRIEEKEFTADSCELAEWCVQGIGKRRLLRFTTAIANLGSGPLIIPGPEEAPELYHYDMCHQHDHLTDFAGYELRDADGNPAALGRKQGFYPIDTAPLCIDSPSSAEYFPSMGISAGWTDVYTSALPCQWLDITNVSDGSYTLRVSVDDNDILAEDDVLPNAVEVKIQIKGDAVSVLP